MSVENYLIKKLEQLSFPSRQIKWIVNDIFGNPFVREKEGSIQSESQEEFNNRYKKFKNKWNEIEKNYTIRNGEDYVTISKNLNSLRWEKRWVDMPQRNLRQRSTEKILMNGWTIYQKMRSIHTTMLNNHIDMLQFQHARKNLKQIVTALHECN